MRNRQMGSQPTEKQTVQALDKLAALRRQLEARAKKRDKLIAAAVAQDPEIAALTAEIEALTGAAGECETFVRTHVLTAEKTAKGRHLMAVFSQGRASWDGKKLDGFAAVHPEILQFKSYGSPTVSIRKV